eukprot:CAMPEP_0179253910 /NCGR_PEP_ID=MMETSP0797-20121207/22975_1 /TAXON_ID=47934 /ORGANISM="Dinophysis acuminata, Strain DAEP01" /LENGTH=57 /DNA_ID=CAMNT_0020961789 /DNA_START=65 /DNA_END=234 /DNA_ORIENTATION=+
MSIVEKIGGKFAIRIAARQLGIRVRRLGKRHLQWQPGARRAAPSDVLALLHQVVLQR